MSSDGDFTDLLARRSAALADTLGKGGTPVQDDGDATIIRRVAPPTPPPIVDSVADTFEIPDAFRAALVVIARVIEVNQSFARELADYPFRAIESLVADLDHQISTVLNSILHHAEFQEMEASWRGLHYLVRETDTNEELKIKLFSISKRELARTLRRFQGTAWDQSPLFRKIYEEEYGQFGGEPFGLIIGDYEFDHRPEDLRVLASMSAIAAAAHVPFVAAAAASLMQMDNWSELANPRDLTRIFQTAEYASWRSLREAEDTRYLGLVLPRVLARLPYGHRTDPIDDFVFEEEVEGPDASKYPWMSAAFPFAANVARAFTLYGWCARIYGIGSGGEVDGLPVLTFPTADGEVDMKCVTEVSLNERREAELARSGLIALVHRKNTNTAAFISAHSLQKPFEFDDEAATTNAIISARLPYIFASSRFAHFLKCMVRDKVGGAKSRDQLQGWLNAWLKNYIDGAPTSSTDEWKATHPLQQASVTIEEKDDLPGNYEARMLLRPHYQLEGLTVALRLVSRVAAAG